MKALSIQQPWANLIATGQKTIETRTWKTNYRGPLAIHASKTLDEYVVNQFGKYALEMLGELHRGAIIATCTLHNIIHYPDADSFEDDILWHMCDRSGWEPGVCGWILNNIQRLSKPIPCRGMPGLFEVELP